ncbi:MAG: undecaprenyl-phosphate glucose phosphotransferase [Clostridiales bacterium]|nr:undecaprenyl-phosphate glucose phosphotransferase [Clostridiales bacterium]MDO5141090.1 undecaprenyl-phosphate glucose phosphotransferase [Eubacteriales bacterium]
MIKNNQSKLNILHVLLDAAVIAVSYAAAFYLVIIEKVGLEGTPGALSAEIYFRALYVIIPLYVLLYGIFRLYMPKRIQSRRRELANICKANIMGLMAITFCLYAGRNLTGIGPYLRNFSTRMIVAFFAINIILETLFRNILRVILYSIRSKGFNQKHMLLVGYSAAAEGFIDRNRENPEWGYHILGMLSDSLEKGSFADGVEVLGELSDLRNVLEQHDFDEIVVTLPLEKYMYLTPIVNICEKSGVHTMFVPDYNNIIPTTPYTEDLEGLPVIHIRHVPLTNPFNAVIKRCMDIFGSCAALILFSPIMLAAALMVKLTSEGPVIFSQERVGLHNKPFKMYKFRSMYLQTPEEEATKWTTKGDPRVTPVGRFIRRFNIDEMPQFINVLKGDMSLVGPRPERPQFVEKFKEEIPRYMIKHQVRPGITGWAQVNGLRGDTSIRRRIEFDLYYIENWTIGLDFKILFQTVFKGFKNAY